MSAILSKIKYTVPRMSHGCLIKFRSKHVSDMFHECSRVFFSSVSHALAFILSSAITPCCIRHGVAPQPYGMVDANGFPYFSREKNGKHTLASQLSVNSHFLLPCPVSSFHRDRYHNRCHNVLIRFLSTFLLFHLSSLSCLSPIQFDLLDDHSSYCRCGVEFE